MFEKVILSNLAYNDQYARKVLPYLKGEYFEEKHDKILFEVISDYIVKYNGLPSQEVLFIDLQNKDKINDKEFEKCKEVLFELEVDKNSKIEWLFDETEKYIKNRAIYLSLLKSIEICNDKENKLDRASIPQILTDAIAISFDSHIGHDFIEDADSRFEYYHKFEDKIPFDIDILNIITGGGASNKTLTILLAAPGTGKTATMCHFAADNLRQGKNVLYITLEMSEEMICQRIDENLMDLDVDTLLMLPKETFLRRIENLKKKTPGKLIVKEYPTRQAGSANFRALIKELKIKKNFLPDIIYIDYLNICLASTLKLSKASLYEYVKVVGEEIRGLAIEFNLPIISASQMNRSSITLSSPGMDSVADSFGTSMTADYIWALITSEELERDSQLQFTQVKNRYHDINKYKNFLVGVNRAKMQLYNVGRSEQSTLCKKEENRIKEEPFITKEMNELEDDIFN